MSLRYPITVAVLATLPIVALAQEPVKSSVAELLTIGSRVRIASSVVTGRPRGRVVAVDDRVVSLLLDEGSAVVKIPVPSITALEVHLGRRRHTLQGLGIGAAFGSVAGLGESVDPTDCGVDSASFYCSRREAIVLDAIVYGGLGALVGWLVTTDRWAAVTVSAVPPPARPGHPGLALAVKVRF